MSTMSIFSQHATLITGVERDPEEPDLIRVYVGPRGNWNFVLTSDESVEREWNNSVRHLFTEVPPGTPIYHDADGKAAAREDRGQTHTQGGGSDG